MKITVIIPVFNAQRTILGCLEALAAQTRPADEIILVDNGSTDTTFTMMNDFCQTHRSMNIVMLRETVRGAGAARNRGIREAAGDVIAFTDSDAYAREDWLLTLERLYGEGPWDGIGGVYRFLRPRSVAEKLQAIDMAIAEGFASKEITAAYRCLFGQMLGTCNASYRKSVLTQIGGFDERLSVTGEDMDLTLRAVERGYRLLSWSPELVVWHEPRETLMRYFKRIFEYRMILPALLKKHFKDGAFVSLPWAGTRRFGCPRPMILTRNFFFWGAAVSAAVLFFCVKAAWHPIFYCAAAFVFFGVIRSVYRRAAVLQMRLSAWELIAMSLVDIFKKLMSAAGRLYGSFKERTIVL